MYLIFGDEADREQARGKKFFVYRRALRHTASIPALHELKAAAQRRSFVARFASVSDRCGCGAAAAWRAVPAWPSSQRRGGYGRAGVASDPARPTYGALPFDGKRPGGRY
jgi:hypothetical protein